MKKITFRPPRPTDFEALYRYAKTIEAEDTFITLSPDEPLTKKAEREHFQTDLKKIKQNNKVITCVFDGKKMIGSCGVERQGRRSRHLGEIGIALLKEYRSEGLGKKLFSYTLKQARKKLKLTTAILQCMAENKVALAFYKKRGFKQYGRLPKANRYKGRLIAAIYFYQHLK